MVSTRRTARNDSFNHRTNSMDSNPSVPLKRVREPSSVPHVFLMVVLNICKKVVFSNTNLRVLIYLFCLFAVSGIVDAIKIPRFYTNYFLNDYFVKFGWFWTLFLTIPFVFMTSYTYCCGKTELLYKHLGRLGIATFFWFFWVNLFVYLEGVMGKCDKRDFETKSTCIGSGGVWKGFDLSGHAFLLIYSNLVLIEEAKPIHGWEGIQDLIRDESHTRDNNLTISGPLRNLNASEFKHVKSSYVKFLPYVRLYFFLIACLSLVWDYMLLSTILFFHSMPEKLFSGIIAVFVWYATYGIWYKIKNISPLAPGEGTFDYFLEGKVEQKKGTTRKGSIS